MNFTSMSPFPGQEIPEEGREVEEYSEEEEEEEEDSDSEEASQQQQQQLSEEALTETGSSTATSQTQQQQPLPQPVPPSQIQAPPMPGPPPLGPPPAPPLRPPGPPTGLPPGPPPGEHLMYSGLNCAGTWYYRMYQFGSFEAIECVADRAQDPRVEVDETCVISSVVSLLLLYCAFEVSGLCCCSQPGGYCYSLLAVTLTGGSSWNMNSVGM